ncbi:LLM class flavin-dependent oxidoreductase [Nocardioides carbamazepini]|uniref:LLM class flavin-dependent oxidoreductase n=1 Tax=Nocardioides carbamazepini TaxID=2854259 RepID=UPI00214A83E3|nr:LLM class flavin-dependent oxidoreductase [Nocardioides carbamazepini]MCR1786090.1 LLM class flavin-dependent oxidoreductase [Nocardioides carbamazepini]
MKRDRKMVINAAVMYGMGQLHDAWRVRQGDADDYVKSAYYKRIALTAERGKLHGVFLAEQITNAETGAARPTGALDTATVLAVMGAVTERVGLVGTASTTYNEPYEVARRFATLDHMTGGRAAWNMVTTAHAGTAAQFGAGPLPDAARRYARAEEFMDVVVALWESWEDDALVGDKETGVFADAAKVHEIDHVGPLFGVKGPLPFPRTPQGRPVVFQAGSSEAGRNQAGRLADVVFCAQHTLEGSLEFRTDIRRRAAAFGRDPDSVKVLPGMSTVIGDTEATARAKKKQLFDTVPIEVHLAGLSKWTGLPVEALELDRPLRTDLLVPDEEFAGGVGWRRSVVGLAVKDDLTVRELLERAPTAHHQVVGTPEQVADAMEERYVAGAADGFNLMLPIVHEALDDVVDLLVPELQRRGLMHLDYEHETLRSNLGLPTASATRVPA